MLKIQMEQLYPGHRGANAVLNIQSSSSISVVYHPKFGSHDDIMLIELEEKLLPDVLQEKVVIRGQPDEDAVLCTQSKTYAIKFVGTSNSVFLVPPSDQFELADDKMDCDAEDQNLPAVAPVLKVSPGSLELVEIAPKIDKLKLLLFENLYKCDEDATMEESEPIKTGLYKWDDLINKIQASDDELKSGLQILSAMEIDGYWRVVDEKYMDLILRMLLHNSVLNNWSLNALDQDKVVNTLQSDGFPCKLAEHCLSVYGSKINNVVTSGMWRLDEKKVCLHFAREILRGEKMKMGIFMDEWMRKIPEEMQASFEMLEGEVLTERLGVDKWVRTFSVSSLPSTPAERFYILFKERPRWEWKDLQPFIRDLKVPGLSSEGLLLKYTRRTQPTPEAEPVFSAR